MKKFKHLFVKESPNTSLITFGSKNPWPLNVESPLLIKTISSYFENAYDLCKEYSRGKTQFNFTEFLEFLTTKNIEITEEIMNSLDINLESYY